MVVRRLAVVLGILLIPTAAYADGHRAGLFGGYSRANQGSWLNGAHFSVECVLTRQVCRNTKTDSYIYVAADYSFHDGEGFKRQVFLVGGNAQKKWKNVTASGRLLVGSVWGDGAANFSWSTGATFQIVPSETSALSNRPHVVPHAQVDYIVRTGSPKSFARISIGAMIKFP